MCNIEFFASLHLIFLKYCATNQHETWLKYSHFYIVYKNPLDDERIWIKIALQYLKCQSCLLGQL